MTENRPALRSLLNTGAIRRLIEPSGWHLLFHYFRPHRLRIALFCIVAAVNSVLALPILYFIKYGFDHAIPHRDVQALIVAGGAILVCRALNSVIIVGLRHNIAILIKSIIGAMRMDLVAKLYVLPREFQGERDIARYQNRIVQDSERVDALCNVIFSSMLPALATAGALTCCLFYLQWKLLIIVFTVVPLAWLTNAWTTKGVQRHVREFQSHFERFSKGVLFILRNRELTQQQAFDRQELERQQATIDLMSNSGIRMAWSFAIHGQVQRNVTGMGAVLLLVVGGISVVYGSLTIGDFMAFFAASTMLNAAVDTVLDDVPGLIAGNESLVLLREILGAEEVGTYHGFQTIAFGGGITLAGVCFSYDEKPVLENVSLRLAPHSVTAIMGPNGAGKSTIVNLIMGILRPDAGALFADSHPYDELDIRNLRRQIGIVPQHPVFFNGTVRENICYGHPDISETALIRALALAQAAAFVSELPLGLETPMGEDGIRLSGGEKQRLALTRALIAGPRLLILDEPANHMDVEGIRALTAALTALPERPTILMISHNADLTSIADRVLRLEAGQLFEDRMGAGIALVGYRQLVGEN